MITAEEARQLAQEENAFISEEIKCRAKRGFYSYEYLTNSRVNISDDLVKVLENAGFIVDIKERKDCNTDHYGKYIPGTEKTYYTVTIKWNKKDTQ